MVASSKQLGSNNSCDFYIPSQVDDEVVAGLPVKMQMEVTKRMLLKKREKMQIKEIGNVI